VDVVVDGGLSSFVYMVSLFGDLIFIDDERTRSSFLEAILCITPDGSLAMARYAYFPAPCISPVFREGPLASQQQFVTRQRQPGGV
jgi:hypothetical protein